MSTAVTVFQPAGATVNVAAGASSSRVALNSTASAFTASQEPSVRLYNAGASVAYVEIGGSTVTATTTASFPIGSGAAEVFRINPDSSGLAYVATICAGTDSAVIYATPGFGC